jgi:zinc and cadmium transporter
MLEYWLYPVLSTVLISVISLVGVVFLAVRIEKLRRILFVLVSFAVGALLGNVFFQLIPESFEMIPSARLIGILVLAGIISMFLLEKVLHWHHDHDPAHAEKKVAAFGPISLVADGLHNFVDGILIAAGWMAGPEVGLATTLAVMTHEIPQEISDYGVLIHAGYSPRKALLVNFLAACMAILGTVITLFLGSKSEALSHYILPFAAGGFIYLAGSDLIPELQKDHSRRNAIIQVAFVIAGLLLMYLISQGHSHSHHVHGPGCEH